MCMQEQDMGWAGGVEEKKDCAAHHQCTTRCLDWGGPCFDHSSSWYVKEDLVDHAHRSHICICIRLACNGAAAARPAAMHWCHGKTQHWWIFVNRTNQLKTAKPNKGPPGRVLVFVLYFPLSLAVSAKKKKGFLHCSALHCWLGLADYLTHLAGHHKWEQPSVCLGRGYLAVHACSASFYCFCMLLC
jgi:hypothetical protein